jgi:transcriptional regulator with XRE-family HTH domain
MSGQPTSPFSKRFASALRGYMREHDIQQDDVAELLNRSTGYVSEHLGGKRSVDMNMVDAVAQLAGLEGTQLLAVIERRMSEAHSEQKRRFDRIVGRVEDGPAEPDEDPGNPDAREA